MTEPDPSNERERLREEAGTWFARMRGPDADTHREAFEEWLARGAAERAAYSRIAETFSLGKGLDESDLAPPRPEPPAPMPTRKRTLAIAAGLVAALISAGLAMLLLRGVAPPAGVPLARSNAATTELATAADETRRFRLADGSQVTLRPGSRVEVAFTATARRLALLRGAGWFDVAHEARPFAVAAAGGLVIAHGTVFEVALSPDRQVEVRLLRGSVEVRMPRPPASRQAKVAVLRPGERIAYAGETEDAAKPEPAEHGLIDFDGARLGEVVARANAASPVTIVLADPDLAQLKVSGTFRLDDARALAAKLALLFDLDAAPDGPSRILLTPHRPSPPPD